MSTLDYYNQHADTYCKETVSADVSSLYSHFEPLLPACARIIDVGCGSGRDTKHFLESGHTVVAVDGSRELCRLAAKYTGIPVRCITFSELDYDTEFDAAWACSSLLHVPKAELPGVMERIRRGLKPGAVFYASFKYGSRERESMGRRFTDCTERDLAELTDSAGGLSLLEYWISEDARPSHRGEMWLNVIWRKNQKNDSP